MKQELKQTRNEGGESRAGQAVIVLGTLLVLYFARAFLSRWRSP